MKAGRGEDYLFFAVADTVVKTTGMPDQYLGRTVPHERFTGKSFNCIILLVWGLECCINQHQQQRCAGFKVHLYAKRVILVYHDLSSLCSYIWMIEEGKREKSAHVTCQPEEELVDIVGKVKAADLSDNKGKPNGEKKRTGRE